ncbi:methyl-accepting chemotaxis protein [Marinobacter persicus]|jgi:methyl-accepting chemotaxis protein|uniref:Methyl-accepting chemotaxis protein n=1 Tax=Marinobacter persicus TaxID=930118 RepID=A0A2S6G5S2_9GAMM|nr:nitrate- and nitrite sensing domain-containing protein [Marinobacter persicus]PPK50382.1 methyl-accepting chemotaxis protein [Marinobacter persicus]PPK54464.1 methyl-accepting chemotaxis protein [Marinobacter persicus]PPK57576.1 methyl-accepting chemotaxis protein [Marinobacter persicus]
MNLINNLSMRGKLITLVLPPLIALILFAAQNITDTAGELKSMQQLQDMVRLAEVGDPVVEQLQKERGRSAVLLASGAGSDAARQAAQALQSQREATDRAVSSYRSELENLLADSTFDGVVQSSIERFEQHTKSLPALRQQIDNRNIAAPESGGRYTEVIMEIVNRVPLLIRRATDPELTRQLNAYFALAEAGEMSGRERAAGASLIRSGNFNLPRLGQITSLAGRQDAYLHSALTLLSAEGSVREKLEAFLSTPENRALLEQRETLLSSAAGMYALEAAEWFSASTTRIEAMNSIGGQMLEQVDSMAEQAVSRARNSLITVSTIAAAATALVIILMLVIIHAIHCQVHTLRSKLHEAMDNKDLSLEIPVTSKDEIGTIAEAINQLFSHFSVALLQIDRSSVQLATATEETSSTATQNASQLKKQQQQIEQVAAATEEMSSTSEEISQNTQEVADAASRAMEKSQTGERVLHSSVSQIRSLAESVQEVNQVIEELEKRSGSISDVVDVIRKVADQTNLLALNAAIEAARAGEHGRGFAVVADEVRTLAQQTHESTTQIEEIINGFKDITGSASRSVVSSHTLANETSEQASEMEKTFAEILTDVNGISDMATQIATASEEQVAVTRELATSMESVSEVAMLSLTGSQEITEVTQEQARLARELQDLANEFKVNDHNA